VTESATPSPRTGDQSETSGSWFHDWWERGVQAAKARKNVEEDFAASVKEAENKFRASVKEAENKFKKDETLEQAPRLAELETKLENAVEKLRLHGVNVDKPDVNKEDVSGWKPVEKSQVYQTFIKKAYDEAAQTLDKEQAKLKKDFHAVGREFGDNPVKKPQHYGSGFKLLSRNQNTVDNLVGDIKKTRVFTQESRPFVEKLAAATEYGKQTERLQKVWTELAPRRMKDSRMDEGFENELKRKCPTCFLKEPLVSSPWTPRVQSESRLTYEDAEAVEKAGNVAEAAIREYADKDIPIVVENGQKEIDDRIESHGLNPDWFQKEDIELPSQSCTFGALLCQYNNKDGVDKAKKTLLSAIDAKVHQLRKDPKFTQYDFCNAAGLTNSDCQDFDPKWPTPPPTKTWSEFFSPIWKNSGRPGQIKWR
jgi:hypothetical protein